MVRFTVLTAFFASTRLVATPELVVVSADLVVASASPEEVNLVVATVDFAVVTVDFADSRGFLSKVGSSLLFSGFTVEVDWIELVNSSGKNCAAELVAPESSGLRLTAPGTLLLTAFFRISSRCLLVMGVGPLATPLAPAGLS